MNKDLETIQEHLEEAESLLNKLKMKCAEHIIHNLLDFVSDTLASEEEIDEENEK